MPRAVSSKGPYRQPTYPAKIDPSHPIGKKVTAAFSAHHSAGPRPVEIISGVPATVAAGTINSVTAGVVGKALKPTSTSAGVYWPFSPAYGGGSQPFSIEVLFTYLGTEANFARLLDFGAAGGGNSGGWDLEYDVTGATLNLVTWTAGVTPNTGAVVSSMVAGRTYHLVFTHAGAGTTTVNAYVNNVASIPPFTFSLAARTAGNFYYATYQTAGGGSAPNTGLHFARIYNGTILTPGEVKRLYEKPFEMFQRPRRIFSGVSSGSPDITLALTGNAGTSAVGSFGAGSLFTKALTGNVATAACGTVLPSLTFGLTGNAGTGAAGTVSINGNVTVSLTGNQATGSLGTLSPAFSAAITGNAGTSAVGTFSRASLVTLGLTGNAGTSAVGTITITGNRTVALTGVSALGSVGSISIAGGNVWTPVTTTSVIWTPATLATTPWTPQ